MRRATLYLLLFAVSLTSSWAQEKAAPSVTPQDSAKATVYIYRYKQFVGAALAPSVYCDDVQLARMENGRYFATTVEPGKHIFRSNDEQSGIVLLATAGQQYFIRVDIAAGFMKGHGRLQLMDGQQGTYELTSDKLKPLDAGKVVAKDRVSVEVASPATLDAGRAGTAGCAIDDSGAGREQPGPGSYGAADGGTRNAAWTAERHGDDQRRESQQHVERPDIPGRCGAAGATEEAASAKVKRKSGLSCLF
jgi:uncharacterized protein DUF2846